MIGAGLSRLHLALGWPDLAERWKCRHQAALSDAVWRVDLNKFGNVYKAEFNAPQRHALTGHRQHQNFILCNTGRPATCRMGAPSRPAITA